MRDTADFWISVRTKLNLLTGFPTGNCKNHLLSMGVSDTEGRFGGEEEKNAVHLVTKYLGVVQQSALGKKLVLVGN